MLGGAGVLLGVAVAPAQAAEVAYSTECIPPPISGLPPAEGTTKVEITAPAGAKVGDVVTVTWKFVQAASKNPDILDLAQNTVRPTGTLRAAGAQTADIAMEGPRSNPPIPKGSDMILSDMTGKLKLTAPGEVTLAPDAYDINVSQPISTDTKCTPKETVQPAATIVVTADGGPTGNPTGSPSPPPPGGNGTGGQTSFTGREVKVPYACKTPIGDKSATAPVQINAEKNGGNFDLTVQFKKSVMNSPADIPKGSVKPSMEVVVGGADKGTVHVEGPANVSGVKTGDPIEIPDLTGTYKPGASGQSALSPGVLTINALGTTTTCTPTKTEVSLTLDTSKQPGGTAGGSSTGGNPAAGGTTSGTSGKASGGATGGGLAQTGSGKFATLRALGLVAGTLVLLGGAVFTFLPRRVR